MWNTYVISIHPVTNKPMLSFIKSYDWLSLAADGLYLVHIFIFGAYISSSVILRLDLLVVIQLIVSECRFIFYKCLQIKGTNLIMQFIWTGLPWIICVNQLWSLRESTVWLVILTCQWMKKSYIWGAYLHFNFVKSLAFGKVLPLQ